MKIRNLIMLTCLAVAALMPLQAFADGRELSKKSFPREFDALTGTSVASGDYIPVYDASADKIKKVDATVWGASLAGLTATATELNYNDITTLGTLAASKTWTSDASLDTVMPTGGLLTVQSGGAITANSGSTVTVNGGLTVDTVSVNKNALSLPGRAKITICGDATTVNNNTVYYGPSQDIGAQGRTCDITAAGNVTEATADEPAFTDMAFQVLSMNCLNDQDANADISFTLRSAAAATTPSVTCTITDGERSCHTNAGTTTAIASGATIAIAAASTSDVGTAQWICELDVAF